MLFLAMALCLTACQQRNPIASKLAESDPIMPIRMTSDTMHVVLTDYVPVLYGDTTLWKGLQWTKDEALECLNLSGTTPIVKQMDIVNRDPPRLRQRSHGHSLN